MKATGDGEYLTIGSVRTLVLAATGDSRKSKMEYYMASHKSNLLEIIIITKMLINRPGIERKVAILPVTSYPPDFYGGLEE